MLSGGTGVEVEELWQEKAILNFEKWRGYFANGTAIEVLADKTAQKQ